MKSAISPRMVVQMVLTGLHGTDSDFPVSVVATLQKQVCHRDHPGMLTGAQEFTRFYLLIDFSSLPGFEHEHVTVLTVVCKHAKWSVNTQSLVGGQ